MGAEAGHRDDLADEPLVHHVPSHDRAFVMEPLRVVDHILPAGLPGQVLRGLELLHGGERRLVGKVVLARADGPEAQCAAFAGHGGPGDHMGLSVLQRLLLAAGGLRLRESLQESLYLIGVGIIHVFQGTARFRQGVAHAVDMAVVQPYGGKDEFPRLDHRSGLALGRVIHTVGNVHVHFPFPKPPKVISPSNSVTEALFS